MGRKNRKNRSKVVEQENISKSSILEMFDIVRSVLEKASQPLKGITEEWENYIEICELLQDIREKQIKYVLKRQDRKEYIAPFMSWLEEHGVDRSAVKVAEFKEGMGLQAQTDVKVSEKFLKIPKKVMMSVETANKSVLASLIDTDRVLQAMSNVSLSLHVLCESADPQSFWKPYLDMLPPSYNTPLYFTQDDVLLLKGSPVFADILNQYRSIARQYAYFFKLFQENSDSVKLPFDVFTYDDYRWAVSTVMTRQNKIPIDNSRQMLALIPLWDMCNHTEGEFTTDYNMETGCGECYALRNFDEGEQVFIYYGPRSNAELVLNNGFLFSANSSDRIEIKLGFSKTDPLYTKRCELLAKLTLLPSGRFHLYKGDDPVDSDLLAYLRVFHMTSDELNTHLCKKERASGLRDFGELVSADNENKCWTFLETRCKLLLKAYPQTYMEDRELLQGETLNERQRMLVQLRYMEKNILQSTVEYIERYRQELEITIQEQKVEALQLVDRENRVKQMQKHVPVSDNKDDSEDDIDIDSITALPQK